MALPEQHAKVVVVVVRNVLKCCVAAAAYNLKLRTLYLILHRLLVSWYIFSCTRILFRSNHTKQVTSTTFFSHAHK